MSTNAEKASLKIAGKLLEHLVATERIIFYTAKDISDKFGKSRQYWDRRMKDGYIKYQQTSAGKVTTNFWLEEFLDKT